MGLSPRTTALTLYAGGLAIVVGSLLVWILWFYPLLGLDYASILPAMYEMRDAFARFGRLDVDYSPFRCLGLPVFANPNAFVWSVFHFYALVLPELAGVVAGALTILVFGYVGCLALLRGLGLRADVATVLVVGWCVQGFAASHVIAGHPAYLQLVLQPLLLGILMRRERSWLGVGLVAFWLAHLVYTSGYYLLLTGIPSIVVASLVLEWLVPARLAEAGLGGVRTVVWNLLLAGPLALVMSAPKILAVLDFTALFPRTAHLTAIATWKALVYTASQYVVPLRYDVRQFTGWWYGNWESYEIILPGVAYFLVYALYVHRRDASVLPVLGVVAFLIVAGTLLSSGVLGPLFSRLPILQSLHVNPRWNGFVLLSFFALVVGVVGSLPRLVVPSWLIAVLGLAFVLAPLQFLDRKDMQIEYVYRQGIDATRHRLGFCYEPIFGYKLEQFPVKGEVDFTSDLLVDPRCYLRSANCRPGAAFTDPSDREALLRYALRDDRPAVAYLKKPSLLLYLAGLVCALVWLARAVVMLGRDDGSRRP